MIGLGYALKDWSGKETNHITLEGHGREAIREVMDLSKTVGWFTIKYPVKLRTHETLDQSINMYQRRLKKNTRQRFKLWFIKSGN